MTVDELIAELSKLSSQGYGSNELVLNNPTLYIDDGIEINGWRTWTYPVTFSADSAQPIGHTREIILSNSRFATCSPEEVSQDAHDRITYDKPIVYIVKSATPYSNSDEKHIDKVFFSRDAAEKYMADEKNYVLLGEIDEREVD